MKSKNRTAAEKAHLSKVASLGCIACRKLGFEGTMAEIHHIRVGMGMGQRNDDYHAIPLCPFHHRQGPDAVHVSPAAFERKFGNELDLLDETMELIK